MRWFGRLAKGLLALSLALLIATVFTHESGDPELFPGEGPRIHVIDHGFHSGIVLRTSDLRYAALEIDETDPRAASRLRWLASRFPEALWIEVGWGDAAFYQATPTIGDVDPWLGLRAILWPTDAVLQVVPVYADPEHAFEFSHRLPLDLGDAGFRALAGKLAETIPDDADPIGPSLYGGGTFYTALLDYHLFRTCNHWVSSLLRAAGVPTSPVPATFSTTLMAELKLRL
ncbi:MAG: DUF2459 domain-containing protein [Pseudomonadota bacterium]